MSQYKYFSENDIKLDGVIHVGAHRGEEIFDYEKLEVKKIIWIEPNPEVFEELQIALERADSFIESHGFCVAASDVDSEEVDFHVCYGPDAGFMRGNKGCSSLLQPQSKMKEWHKQTIKVETCKLDTLIEKNGFNFSEFQLLDMDTQGAELMVLSGAHKLLENIKYVATEATWNNPEYVGCAQFDELKQKLFEYGFEMVELFEHTSDWGDALFVKNN